jgi:hypothetical protein
LALAMHNYESTHGHLPPAVVYGADGKPLHSWRVLILPYIEQGPLYERFRLDEPWDSPHNLALLPEMPGTYAPPGRKKAKVPPYHTVCQVFHGPGAAFEGLEGFPLEDFADGTSNTILIVEAGEPVPWTKPQDLPYHPDRPLPDLTPLFKDGIRAIMADATRRFIKTDTPEEVLRAAITRSGGEKNIWLD